MYRDCTSLTFALFEVENRCLFGGKDTCGTDEFFKHTCTDATCNNCSVIGSIPFYTCSTLKTLGMYSARSCEVGEGDLPIEESGSTASSSLYLIPHFLTTVIVTFM